MARLEGENSRLSVELENRKVIERAKGILQRKPPDRTKGQGPTLTLQKAQPATKEVDEGNCRGRHSREELKQPAGMIAKKTGDRARRRVVADEISEDFRNSPTCLW